MSPEQEQAQSLRRFAAIVSRDLLELRGRHDPLLSGSPAYCAALDDLARGLDGLLRVAAGEEIATAAPSSAAPPAFGDLVGGELVTGELASEFCPESTGEVVARSSPIQQPNRYNGHTGKPA